MDKGNKMMFMHSGCCMAHWELVYFPEDESYRLQCEKCGKPAGSEIKVSGPKIDAGCDVCGEKQGEE